MNANPDEYIWSGPPDSTVDPKPGADPPPPQPFLLALLELSKAKKVAFSLATVFAGYFCAHDLPFCLSTLEPLLLGCAMSLSGAATLNQWIERDRDLKMIRTRNRPIPSGRISPTEALVFGLLLLTFGVAILYAKTNLLTAALAAAGAFIYIIIYPFMKSRSVLSTHIGAVSGAIPPLLGWTAATNSAREGGEALFIILFLWQIPHFMAQASIHRNDFFRGGYKNLPVIDNTGLATTTVVLFHILLLFPACYLLVVADIIGPAGFIFSVALGLTQLFCGIVFYKKRTTGSAKLLFRHSIFHLALLLAMIIASRAVSSL